MLRENVESLDKIIKNLRTYMTKQEQYAEDLRAEVSEIEEDVLGLEDLRDDYKRTLDAREKGKLMRQGSV